MANDLTYFKRNGVNFYGVFDSNFDNGNPYNDILTDVRKKYYESGLKTQRKKFIKRTDNGDYKYVYNLNEDAFLKWKVFRGSTQVERVVISKEDNYRVEVRDDTGKVLKKNIYFGLYHNWVKTKYYVEGKERPEIELVQWDEKGVSVILKFTADGDDRYPMVLYPCQVVSDKALQKKLFEKLGVPDVSALCSKGFVYFAEKNVSRQWNKYCANPNLLNDSPENKENTKSLEKTAEFVRVDTQPKPAAEKKKIDLTQTVDVIVPDAVQTDKVVINNAADTAQSDSGITIGNIRNILADVDNMENDNQNQLVSKLHSDSLKDFSEEGTVEFSKPKKTIDVFEYLNEPDVDVVTNSESNQSSETTESNNKKLNIDLDDDDDDVRILDRTAAAGNEPPQIFGAAGLPYDSNMSASSALNNKMDNPFAEFGEENEDVEVVSGSDGISAKSQNKASDYLQHTIESNAKINEKSDTDRKKSYVNSSPVSDGYNRSYGYSGNVGNSPDKIIRVSDDEVYYYYGSLNHNHKRDGHGRTAMKDGKTAYDGGYSNDLRNGFGVYYYRNGNICYVGDWQDNHRHGVGISFSHQNRSMYVGGWENDCPIGMGAKFDENGNLTFAGRYENGTREGVGMVYNPHDGGVFVSCWDNDKLSDRGTVFDSMGNLVYNGSWKKGTRNGMGTQYDKKGLVVYSGEWKDGKYNGEGSLNLSNGYKIVGQFVMGKVEGYAVVTTKKGKKLYEGNWKNNRYDGEGKLYNMRNGSWCQGTFSNGNPVGILAGYNQDGEKIYEGEWLNGKYHGSGKLFEKDEKIYEGQWENGIKNGTGSEFKNGICIYSGEFKNNARSGFGTSYNSESEIEYSGLWTDNCYDGLGLLYDEGKPRFVGNFSLGRLNGRVNELLNGVVVKECIYKEGECIYMREYTNDGLTLRYEGHVKNGHYEGMGCSFSAYGEKYFEGIFKKNEPFKNMKVRFKKLEKLSYSDELAHSDYNKFIKGPNYVVEQDYHGGAYSGLLVKGKPSGKGTIIYTDHGYTGSFSDGKACGLGVIYEWDGSEIKGTFAIQAGENTTEITLSGGVTYHLVNS